MIDYIDYIFYIAAISMLKLMLLTMYAICEQLLLNTTMDIQKPKEMGR